MENINTDALIPLVEERRVLWDKTLQIYKNKQLTTSAWREIFCKLNPNFSEMQQKERQEFGKVVVKRWTYIRDSWMKSYKKRKDRKSSGTLKKSSRPYIYHEQMAFLKTVAEIRTKNDSANKIPRLETNTDQPDVEIASLQHSEVKQADTKLKIEPDFDEPNFDDTSQHSQMPKIEPDTLESNIEITSQYSLQPRVKKQKANRKNSAMVQFLYNRLKSDDNNRHLLFFRGILTSLNSFNDEDTLEFQAGILSLIQKIKRKQRQQLYNPEFIQLSMNNTMTDCQYRPQFSTQQSQRILNQSMDSLPSTSGYFGQRNQVLDPPIPSPASSSAEESSTEFNFEDGDL